MVQVADRLRSNDISWSQPDCGKGKRRILTSILPPQNRPGSQGMEPDGVNCLHSAEPQNLDLFLPGVFFSLFLKINYPFKATAGK